MLRSPQVSRHCCVWPRQAWSWMAIVALFVVESALADVSLRGISPEDEKFYSSPTIWCKDGSRSFPRERLNDDFCDCVDGTDEPGTSACPDGQFYCKNKGHVSTYIFSSRVNDGICDCCDGSDEYEGKVKCKNTCWEVGKTSRAKLQKTISTLKEGLVVKKKDVELAKQLRVEHETKLSNLKKEEKLLSDAVSKLKVKKEAVEKAEKEEQLEKEKKEKEEREERERKEKENRTPPENSDSPVTLVKTKEEEDDDDDFTSDSIKQDHPSATTHESDDHVDRTGEAVSPLDETADNKLEDDIAASLDVNEEASLEKLSKEELGRVIASRWTGEQVSVEDKELQEDKAEDHKVDTKLQDEGEAASGEGEEENLESLSKEELGKVIASRWTGEYTGEKTTQKDEHGDGDETQDVDMHHHHDYEHDDDDDEEYDQADEDLLDEDQEPEKYIYEEGKSQDDSAFSSLQPTTSTLWSKIKDKAQALLRSVRISKIPFNKSDAEQIRNEFDEASSKLRGVQSEISDLEGKLKQDLGKEGEFYNMYQKCFERKQNKYTYKVCLFKDATQLEGHSSTRLGSWQGFQDEYSSMVFENGERCWNGPDRSLRIALRCGPKSELLNIDEPSRCEYVADFSTPAACREEKLQALQQQLHEETEVPEIHEEL